MAASGGALQRRLGLADAVVVGAGSMVGAGVFAAWSPAADAAGTGLLVGLALAGVVAFCNATSSAQLAAVHPQSGGTYVSGGRQLGPRWGHLAGWGFVVGKLASCAAMGLTVGAYLWPQQERLVAVLAVLAITAVNLGGLTRTVAVTKGVLAVSLVALAAVVASGWTASSASLERLAPVDGAPLDWLRAGALLFFAFAGYARIATLGEEVREPAVTIPKAVPRALGGVLVLYAVVGVTALAAVGPDALAATDAPLRVVVEAGDLDRLAPLTRIGAGIAALGVLLNLIPGISRTVLAMARERDLPGWFSHVDVQRSLPVRAELAVAAVVIALVLAVDLRGAIGISGVAVLTYYAVTNMAALTLSAAQRRWPRWIAWLGLVGCVVLALAVPVEALLIGATVLATGVAVRNVTSRATRPPR